MNDKAETKEGTADYAYDPSSNSASAGHGSQEFYQGQKFYATPQAAMPGSMPQVAMPGSQIAYTYCLPTAVALELRSSHFGDLIAKDQHSGLPVFTVQRQNAFRDTMMIHDARGNPLVVLRQKLIAFRTTIKAYHPMDREYTNELFTVTRRSAIFKTKYKTTTVDANGKAHRMALTIGFLGQNGKFLIGESDVVGTWDRKLKLLQWIDINQSSLKIVAGVDLIPLIALCVAYESDQDRSSDY